MSLVRVVGITVVLVLAGCGGRSAEPFEIAEPMDEVVAAESTSFVSTVLLGTASQVDGTDFDLASLQGSDVVVWFWAPW